MYMLSRKWHHLPIPKTSARKSSGYANKLRTRRRKLGFSKKHSSSIFRSVSSQPRQNSSANFRSVSSNSRSSAKFRNNMSSSAKRKATMLLQNNYKLKGSVLIRHHTA